MLDLSDPKVWKDGANVVLNSPHIVVPLATATAIAAWWFRGKIEKAIINGLRERISALEERRQLAEDNAQSLVRKMDELKSQVTTLRAEISSGAPMRVLESTTATIGSTVAEITTLASSDYRIIGSRGTITVTPRST